MEAKLLPQNYRYPFSTAPAPRRRRVRVIKPESCRVVAVLARPRETRNAKPRPLESGVEVVQRTVYNDSWFDQIAINHLSQCVQDATGFFLFFLFFLVCLFIYHEMMIFVHYLCSIKIYY